MFRRLLSRLQRPTPFYRPNSTRFVRMVNLLLPPSPRSQPVLYNEDVSAYCRPSFYMLSFVMLASVQGLTHVQERLWRGFSYSPVKFGYAVLQWIVKNAGVKTPARKRIRQRRMSQYLKQVPKLASVSFISRMAAVEEQWFREGSENWSTKQRIISCLSFGFVHQGNMIYPLSTVLPLSGAGAVFMAVYLHTFRRTGNRRDAVLAAAALHTTYNRCAYIASGLSVIYYIVARFMRAQRQHA